IPRFTTSIEGCLSHQQILSKLTRVKRAEEKLLLYKFMVDSAHDAIFFKDLQSRYIIANQNTLSAFALSDQEVIGKNDYELMPDREEAKKNVEDDQIVFKTGSLVEITKHMTAADGSQRWFQAIKVPQFDTQGNIIGLVGIARDVTASKLMEIELRKHRDHLEELVKERSQELVESEKRFKDIAENACVWVWEVDVNGKYTYASPVVEEILGYKSEEIVGKKYFYDLFLPEDREELKKAAFEVFKSKQSFRDFINQNVHKNGKMIWLSTSGVPILDEKGNLLGYRGADNDITERKQMEAILIESEEKYRNLVERANDGICIIHDSLFKYVNPQFGLMLGYSAEEMLNTPFVRYLHPDELLTVTDRYYRRMSGEEVPQRYESVLKAKDGQAIEVEINAGI
ncbi:MAG: PAS domain S-box protein, partial [Candidatus Desantisbacteria bacterium]